MSDPTIRLSTCRGDGRCPECGRDVPYSGGLLPTLCGCRVCSSGCCSQHERRLLTEALRQRDAALGEAAHWKTSDEAWVAVADRAMAILGNPHSSDLIGVAEKAAQERDAAIREHQRALGEAAEIAQGLQSKLDEVTRERDEARAQLVDLAHGYALDITASRALGKLTLERADRDEALLREIAAVPLVGLTLGSVLLAKIREVVR